MPPFALFKSKPKLKSDRRLQWKTLKAKHAKTISQNKLKVEVGLGKALDKYQVAVNAILALDASQIDEAAFGPVRAAAAEVRRMATNLGPTVKGVFALSEIEEFLKDLREDADWWDQAYKEVGKHESYLYQHEEKELAQVLKAVNALKGPMNRLDTLLKPALKKTKTYTPDSDAVTWNKYSQSYRGKLAKFDVLAKKPKHNLKLLIALGKTMQPDLSNLRTKAMHMNDISKQGYPPVTDWKAVEQAATQVMNLAREGDRAMDTLADLK